VWSPALVLALALALDPLRLGLILLMISRSRPAQSLLAYWVGAMTVSVPYMLVPLLVLHVIPTFRSFAQHLSAATFTSPTVRHTQIGIGVLTLLIAALMAIRFRARQRAYVPTSGSTTSTLVADSNTSNTSTSVSWLGRAQDATTEDGHAIRRLRARALNAWENGSPWPAFMFGVASGPPPVTALLVLTTIMASGAAIGTQVSLALAWVVGMFAVVEIILISQLVTPAKTRAVLQLLHDWTLAHRRQVLIAMFAVIGVMMMVYGMGAIQAGG
jgi:hypothetical protein